MSDIISPPVDAVALCSSFQLATELLRMIGAPNYEEISQITAKVVVCTRLIRWF